ncbi:unnamed protein product [Ambrosiozyma monospora]|uniref:Unnamed protein product n=1 Tax=Ambrosiozyma monospora TaxID=43982 RepID=A0ACB5SVL9_AMBMO|nr:unnamed protein product [Ambrosiozyma monospora]
MEKSSGNSRSTKVKKPRKIRQSFVCSNCKRKKIKCDKQFPCHNCVKAKLTDTCRYSILPTDCPDPRPVNHSPAHPRNVPYPQQQQEQLKEPPSPPQQQHVFGSEASSSSSSVKNSPADTMLKSELDVLKQKIVGLENVLRTNMSRSASTNETLIDEPGILDMKLETLKSFMISQKASRTSFYGPLSPFFTLSKSG